MATAASVEIPDLSSGADASGQAEVGSSTEVAAAGARIKALREAMGYSLRDLSERSGVSPTMLSQVERGTTSPTLAVASRIASGLDLSLSQLLRLDETPHVVVGRAGDHRRDRRGGHRIEELTPPLPGLRADISSHELEPGASTGRPGDAPMHEPGSRETAVVLEGEVVLVFGVDSYMLGPGDSVTFDADLPHHFENQSDATTRFVAVIAAGLRRG
jgi:transcriptional regulator with XRE-family HTH domain